MAAISPRITQGSAGAGASPSPTPCDLRYLIILIQPASPRLCQQHTVKPAGKGWGIQEGESPDPATEAAGPAGLGKPLQLQPLPVATRPVGAGVPGPVHSLRCIPDRPVASGLSRHTCLGHTWQRDSPR